MAARLGGLIAKRQANALQASRLRLRSVKAKWLAALRRWVVGKGLGERAASVGAAQSRSLIGAHQVKTGLRVKAI